MVLVVDSLQLRARAAAVSRQGAGSSGRARQRPGARVTAIGEPPTAPGAGPAGSRSMWYGAAMKDKWSELMEVLRQANEAIHAALEAERSPSADERVRALLDRANDLRKELGHVEK